MDWNIKMLISAGQSALICVHLVKKFGEIRNSDPRVLREIYTAGVDNIGYHA